MENQIFDHKLETALCVVDPADLARLKRSAEKYDAACNRWSLAVHSNDPLVRCDAAGAVYDRRKAFTAMVRDIRER